MKKVLAGLIGSALILGMGMSMTKAEAASLDEVLTKREQGIVQFEGMAYREREEEQERESGMAYRERREAEEREAEERRVRRNRNENNREDRIVKWEKGDPIPGYWSRRVKERNNSKNHDDDKNGMDAFNRTHGRDKDGNPIKHDIRRRPGSVQAPSRTQN